MRGNPRHPLHLRNSYLRNGDSCKNDCQHVLRRLANRAGYSAVSNDGMSKGWGGPRGSQRVEPGAGRAERGVHPAERGGGRGALMGAPQDDQFDAAIARAIGAELQYARKRIPWTRSELISRLPSEIHVQTLAAYERGIRQLTVVRFVEICQALGVSPPEILTWALQRAGIDLPISGVQVDLRTILNDERPELATLNSWARHRIEADPLSSAIARLDWALVQEMAMMFGIDRSEFVKLLITFTPRPVPRPRSH